MIDILQKKSTHTINKIKQAKNRNKKVWKTLNAERKTLVPNIKTSPYRKQTPLLHIHTKLSAI